MVALTVDVRAEASLMSRIRPLYEREFPYPLGATWDELLSQVEQPNVVVSIAEDEQRLLAFSINCRLALEATLVMYLAVDPGERSAGTGGRLLESVHGPAVLEIEPVPDDADSTDPRRRRLLFYERHRYRVLSTSYLAPTGEDEASPYWLLGRDLKAGAADVARAIWRDCYQVTPERADVLAREMSA